MERSRYTVEHEELESGIKARDHQGDRCEVNVRKPSQSIKQESSGKKKATHWYVRNSLTGCDGLTAWPGHKTGPSSPSSLVRQVDTVGVCRKYIGRDRHHQRRLQRNKKTELGLLWELNWPKRHGKILLEKEKHTLNLPSHPCTHPLFLIIFCPKNKLSYFKSRENSSQHFHSSLLREGAGTEVDQMVKLMPLFLLFCLFILPIFQSFKSSLRIKHTEAKCWDAITCKLIVVFAIIGSLQSIWRDRY